jgi:cysteine synthase A
MLSGIYCSIAVGLLRSLPGWIFYYRVTDAEAVSMARYLVQNDGLFLGSSSACNLVACIKLARKMGWKGGQTIVTVLWVLLFNYEASFPRLKLCDRCDSGSRHYSKVSLIH